MHIPALRFGRAYESLDKAEVKDCRTGAVRSTVSQVNAGIIRKDLRNLTNPLRKFTHAELIALTGNAAEIFMASPDDYVATLSSTSGLPHVLVRRNMQRIHGMMSNIGAVLRGLTRGLDLDNNPYCFYPAAKCLGLVMPSNSPAVNSLWLPAIALKMPVVIKPGRDEPWTPYRLIQSFIQAGVPAEAFGFYPTDHEGADAIVRLCGRALVFGDKSVAEKYAGNPAVQVHGPGYSKVLIGGDQIEHWPEFIDMLADSIAANGGRSCLNASAVVVPKCATEIADALAQRLGPVAPTPPDDPNARLAGFANPKMADGIDANIEQDLPGAEDVTARYRNGPRKAVLDGGVYLRPTIVHCKSFAHPLANREFLFPYASVVEVPQADMLEQIGPSLVVTAITRDEAWIERLKESPHIDRLNIGPVSTMTISWDQPHEGNLFEFLYKRRAFHRAP